MQTPPALIDDRSVSTPTRSAGTPRYRRQVDKSESGHGQWTVRFDGDGADDPEPSRFVEVQVTHQFEVTDLAALQLAVEELNGAPSDEVDRRLRQVPANLVGWLFQGLQPPLPDLPGVIRRGSGHSAGEYVPEAER